MHYKKINNLLALLYNSVNNLYPYPGAIRKLLGLRRIYLLRLPFAGFTPARLPFICDAGQGILAFIIR
jgi:hypothetical protein